MMKRRLIACTMQMDVIRYVMRQYHRKIPIAWISRTFHNQKQILHAKIQDFINCSQDADEILLSYGLCGNAVLGLRSEKTKLVVPNFDDCISQLLYTDRQRPHKRIAFTEKGCYYLTREWTMDQEAIVPQCQKICQMYGEDNGRQIIQQIYSGYHSLVLLDTGAYDVAEIHDYAKQGALYTGMQVRVEKGSCDIMKKLILRNYDQTIAVFEPGEKITRQRLTGISL